MSEVAGFRSEHAALADLPMQSEPTLASPDESRNRPLPLAEARDDLELARALLTMGSSGVDLWNANRARDPRKPKLDQIDLTQRDLSKVELSNCSLRGAKLNGARLVGAKLSYADLRGASLIGADLSGADLTGTSLRDCHLEGASFKRARLLTAQLSGATLRWADLRNADLRNANLENVAFDPCQWGGTDLTGAQLSGEALDELRSGVASLETGGDHPKRVFFALIGACVFSAITALSADDISLIVGMGHIRVPLLDTEVSPRTFFFAAPVVCVALMAYVATYVRQLRRLALDQPAVFWDGTSLAERLTPWLQIVAPSRVQRRAVREDLSDQKVEGPTLARRLSTQITHWLVPATITILFVTYGRARAPATHGVLCLVTAAAWIASVVAWRPFATTTRERLWSQLFVILVIAASSAVLLFDQRWTGALDARSASIDGRKLSQLDLREAQLSFAGLERALLDDVDLSGALLLSARLKESSGVRVNLGRARLTKADLSSSYYRDSNFSRGQWVQARLREAQFTYVSFRQSDLREVDLRGARLSCVDFRQADLSAADLTGVVASEVVCDQSTRWPTNAGTVRAACNAPIGTACRQRLALVARSDNEL